MATPGGSASAPPATRAVLALDKFLADDDEDYQSVDEDAKVAIANKMFAEVRRGIKAHDYNIPDKIQNLYYQIRLAGPSSILILKKADRVTESKEGLFFKFQQLREPIIGFTQELNDRRKYLIAKRREVLQTGEAKFDWIGATDLNSKYLQFKKKQPRCLVLLEHTNAALCILLEKAKAEIHIFNNQRDEVPPSPAISDFFDSPLPPPLPAPPMAPPDIPRAIDRALVLNLKP